MEHKRFKALFGDIAATLDPLPKPQDYLDLDAAGFLLVALGHLTAAREKLDREPPSRGAFLARRNTIEAANFVRVALKYLDEHAKGAAKG